VVWINWCKHRGLPGLLLTDVTDIVDSNGSGLGLVLQADALHAMQKLSIIAAD
jgi:hypothetical protein